jgi:hypothetical protein
MQIPVLIEPIDGKGYRARGAEPFALVGEGPTREAALAKLKELVDARLRSGVEIVSLEIPPQSHPWLKYAGMFKDDPMLEDWKQAMAEYRKRIDEDPDSPWADRI